jgi:hypothetical protein
MADYKDGALTGGLKLLWQHQRLLWWICAVNFLLAMAGVMMALRPALAAVLDYSLEAKRLVTGFDAPTFAALMMHPSAPTSAAVPASLLAIFIFFLYMLFLTGGILEVYRRHQKLRTGEFFEACGRFFWRFVRLLIFLLILLIPVNLLSSFVQQWSGKLAGEASWGMLGFWVQVGGTAVVLFLLMVIRLVFDMAQVRAVAEDVRPMRRALLDAFKMTWRNFGTLFWIYLRLSFATWAGTAVLLWMWVRWVRPEWVGVSFLIGQAIVLLWIGTRLWLRASETCWYQQQGPQASEEYLEKLVA